MRRSQEQFVVFVILRIGIVPAWWLREQQLYCRAFSTCYSCVGRYHPQRHLQRQSTVRKTRTVRYDGLTRTSIVPWQEQPSSLSPYFVSIPDAMAKVRNETVKFIDASWYHRGTANPEFRTSFEEGPRIPGSIYLDLEHICSCGSTTIATASSSEENPSDNNHPNVVSLSFMLPTPSIFGRVMDLGNISRYDEIVLYGQDCRAVFLPRVWFTFCIAMKHLGPVKILSGTLQGWIQQGGPLEEYTSPKNRLLSPAATDKTASLYFGKQEPVEWTKHVVDANRVLTDSNGRKTIVLDSRGSSFSKNGYIPGAIHIPYSSLMAVDDGKKESSSYFKDRDSLIDLFRRAGIDPKTNQTIVCSCGHGISACSLYLALLECGRPDKDDSPKGIQTFLYDGSWEEWEQIPSLPKILPSQNGGSR